MRQCVSKWPKYGRMLWLTGGLHHAGVHFHELVNPLAARPSTDDEARHDDNRRKNQRRLQPFT